FVGSVATRLAAPSRRLFVAARIAVAGIACRLPWETPAAITMFDTDAASSRDAVTDALDRRFREGFHTRAREIQSNSDGVGSAAMTGAGAIDASVSAATRTPSNRMRRSSGTRFKHSPAVRRIACGSCVGDSNVRSRVTVLKLP